MPFDRLMGWIDQNGEVRDDSLPVVVPRKRRGTLWLYGQWWFQMSQNAAIELSKDKDLRGRPKDVLLYLYGTLDFDNYVETNASRIGREIDIDASAVRKCLRLLRDKGVILEGPSVGNSRTWRLNPKYGFKGNPVGKVTRDGHGRLRLVVDNSGSEIP